MGSELFLEAVHESSVKSQRVFAKNRLLASGFEAYLLCLKVGDREAVTVPKSICPTGSMVARGGNVCDQRHMALP